MELDERIEGDVTVVTVYTPQVDAAHAEELKHALTDVLRRHPRVVLDLSNVEMVDSSGLGAIATMQHRVAQGGELALCGARDPVLTLLRVSRIDKVFSVHANLAEAIASLLK